MDISTIFFHSTCDEECVGKFRVRVEIPSFERSLAVEQLVRRAEDSDPIVRAPGESSISPTENLRRVHLLRAPHGDLLSRPVTIDRLAQCSLKSGEMFFRVLDVLVHRGESTERLWKRAKIRGNDVHARTQRLDGGNTRRLLPD